MLLEQANACWGKIYLDSAKYEEEHEVAHVESWLGSARSDLEWIAEIRSIDMSSLTGCETGEHHPDPRDVDMVDIESEVDEDAMVHDIVEHEEAPQDDAWDMGFTLMQLEEAMSVNKGVLTCRRASSFAFDLPLRGRKNKPWPRSLASEPMESFSGNEGGKRKIQRGCRWW